MQLDQQEHRLAAPAWSCSHKPRARALSRAGLTDDGSFWPPDHSHWWQQHAGAAHPGGNVMVAKLDHEHQREAVGKAVS